MLPCHPSRNWQSSYKVKRSRVLSCLVTVLNKADDDIPRLPIDVMNQWLGHSVHLCRLLFTPSLITSPSPQAHHDMHNWQSGSHPWLFIPPHKFISGSAWSFKIYPKSHYLSHRHCMWDPEIRVRIKKSCDHCCCCACCLLHPRALRNHGQDAALETRSTTLPAAADWPEQDRKLHLSFASLTVSSGEPTHFSFGVHRISFLWSIFAS